MNRKYPTEVLVALIKFETVAIQLEGGYTVDAARQHIATLIDEAFPTEPVVIEKTVDVSFDDLEKHIQDQKDDNGFVDNVTELIPAPPQFNSLLDESERVLTLDEVVTGFRITGNSPQFDMGAFMGEGWQVQVMRTNMDPRCVFVAKHDKQLSFSAPEDSWVLKMHGEVVLEHQANDGLGRRTARERLEHEWQQRVPKLHGTVIDDVFQGYASNSEHFYALRVGAHPQLPQRVHHFLGQAHWDTEVNRDSLHPGVLLRLREPGRLKLLREGDFIIKDAKGWRIAAPLLHAALTKKFAGTNQSGSQVQEAATS